MGDSRSLREIRDSPTSLDAIFQSALLEKIEEAAVRLAQSREVMDAREAADFLRISYATFKELAPSLPRHRVSENRLVYRRSELLEWLTKQ